MDKCEYNIFKNVLIAGQETCAGGDILKECIEWCKQLNVRCLTKETDPISAKARTDKFYLKKVLWAENDKERRENLNELKKVKEI